MPALLAKQKVSNMGRYLTVFGKKSNGAPDLQGYPRCKVTKGGSSHDSRSYMLHRIVCIAFHGVPEDGQEVDHIDGDTSNAKAFNLRWVSHSTNVKASFNNPARGSSALSLGKPILARKHGSNDEWVLYPSRTAAATALKITLSGSLASAASDDKGRNHAGGYEFKEVEGSVDTDEEWRKLTTHPDCWVSNKGRFCFPDGRVTMGSKRTDGSHVVQIGDKKKPVKALVSQAFAAEIGPPPSDKHQLCFIDLYDKKATVTNLCWRTKSEQKAASHAKGDHAKASVKEKKRVFSRRVGASTWTMHDSQTECAAALGMSAGHLSTILKEGKSAKGYEFSYEPEEDLTGEVWMDIEDEWLDMAVCG